MEGGLLYPVALSIIQRIDSIGGVFFTHNDIKSAKEALNEVADLLSATCTAEFWVFSLKLVFDDLDDFFDELAFDALHHQLGYYTSFSNPLLSCFFYGAKLRRLVRKIEDIIGFVETTKLSVGELQINDCPNLIKGCSGESFVLDDKSLADMVEPASYSITKITKQPGYPSGDYKGKETMPPAYEDPHEISNIGDIGVNFEEGKTKILCMQKPEYQKPRQWKALYWALCAVSKMRALVLGRYKIMMLYCLLFGENYEFEREKLIQLWMAAGFLKKEPLEDNGDRIFNFFLNKKYFLPLGLGISMKESMYKVNFKLVSDAFARKDFKMRIEDDNIMANQFAESWHISVQSSNVDQTIQSLKKFGMLKTLLFLNGPFLTHVAPDFFSTFKLLTVLDLSGSYLTELPSSISDATELHYVDLSWTPINKLPRSIVHLEKLQTLRLKGCTNLFELPGRMMELISLRHLDFDVLGQLILMPRGIGDLVELRTLPAFIVDVVIIDGKKCSNILELKYMNNLAGKLCISGLEHVSSGDAKEAALINKECLKHLELRWSDIIEYLHKEELVRVLENLKPHIYLEELKIICYPGECLPNWIGNPQFNKLHSITLFKCENCSNFPCLGKLPELKNLEIFEMNNVKKIDLKLCDDDKDCASYPLLENLLIDGMYKVEMWEGITEGDFPCLVKLSINRCPNLRLFPSFPRRQSLKNLEISDCPQLKVLPEEMLSSLFDNLSIDSCPLLSKTYSSRGKHSHKIKHVNNVWIESEETQSSSENSTEEDT